MGTKLNQTRNIWGFDGTNDLPGGFLKMTAEINILEKPIERIRQTCAMMGVEDKFDRALTDLETFLEAEVADGVTSETRLTCDGLCFLKDRFRQ
jgi:hypothetical protein